MCCILAYLRRSMICLVHWAMTLISAQRPQRPSEKFRPSDLKEGYNALSRGSQLCRNRLFVRSLECVRYSGRVSRRVLYISGQVLLINSAAR